MKSPWQPFLASVLGLILSLLPPQVLSVGCFVCTSFNRSDPSCTDPFHPAWGQYVPACEQGLRGRVGLFPAYYCVKMSGRNRRTQMELVVRTCSIESMNHQCGLFVFDDEQYEGCLTSCGHDGCNAGQRVAGSWGTMSWWGMLGIITVMHRCVRHY